ncbi:MAG: sulfate reduction electron transfer complex DsrMKJOP subunit DsrM [Pirellulales bacterium]|nr:sulfate reduction electron transfer complex DsrMKJOP subunit DsrM [Pirellulales bacterium]
MRVMISLAAVCVLFALGWLGAMLGLEYLFGVVIPCLAIVLFLGGMVYRVMSWANVPVPFRIPTTCGQQKSLPWIEQQKFENPDTTLGVLGRMALEILLFRSLLRNTKTELVDGRRLLYGSALLLWLGALAMHWSLLIILIRHVRFFTAPVPYCITLMQQAEGIHEIGLPVFYVTSFVFVAALAYLLARRLTSPQLRYISLANDYFPLFLLLGIGLSGILMRHVLRTDVEAVKELAMGWVTFAPTVPAGLTPLFFGHLMLACTLLAYLPFSKLCHVGGVFLSPTRNLANTNRTCRHINPWNYPVKVHSYEDYEDELRDKLKAAGLPVEKE